MIHRRKLRKQLLKRTSLQSNSEEDKISTAEEVKHMKESENQNHNNPTLHKYHTANPHVPESINKNKTTILSTENDLEQNLVEEKDQEAFSDGEVVENNPQENQQKFVELFKEKLNIVEDFFNSELAAHIEKYNRLVNKIDDKKCSIIGGSFSLPKENHRAKEHFRHNFMKENAERDELGFAVSWKRAFSQLYNLTSWLHSYCTINFIACQKMLKKFKKTLKEQGIENADEELSEHLKSLNFISKLKDVIELRKKIKVFYADEFTLHNQDTAERELTDRMKGNRSKDRTLIAFNLGMIISNLLGIILLWLLHSK
jgi:hypothetical protein